MRRGHPESDGSVLLACRKDEAPPTTPFRLCGLACRSLERANCAAPGGILPRMKRLERRAPVLMESLCPPIASSGRENAPLGRGTETGKAVEHRQNPPQPALGGTFRGGGNLTSMHIREGGLTKGESKEQLASERIYDRLSFFVTKSVDA
jgi:hypothetical protein